jgi:hypothetical protein
MAVSLKVITQIAVSHQRHDEERWRIEGAGTEELCLEVREATHAGGKARTQDMRMSQTLPDTELRVDDRGAARFENLDGDRRSAPATLMDIAKAAAAEAIANVDLERGDEPGLGRDLDALLGLDGVYGSAKKSLLDDVRRVFELLGEA